MMCFNTGRIHSHMEGDMSEYPKKMRWKRKGKRLARDSPYPLRQRNFFQDLFSLAGDGEARSSKVAVVFFFACFYFLKHTHTHKAQ